MPLPKPVLSENEQQFISRCMTDPTMQGDYPDTPQRAAVCYVQWRERKKEVNNAEQKRTNKKV